LENNTFLDTYLREIGVQMPVSLFTAASAQSMSTQTAEAALPVSSTVQDVVVQTTPASEMEAEPLVMKTLDELSQDAADCRLCGLAETRHHVVFGTGNQKAELLFIGEAPGRDEDLKGEPFVGRAGQLLDRMLQAIGLDRQQVYIMNTIKCRPPNNRDPKQDEVQACHLWFEQQLDLLQPKVICLLGRVAAQTVLNSDAPLGSLRGQWHDYQGIPVRATYHPAYLLRSPQQKYKSWQDLRLIRDCLQS